MSKTKCSPKLLLLNENNFYQIWFSYSWFMTLKIDFECQILDFFKHPLLWLFTKYNIFVWVCIFICWNLPPSLKKFHNQQTDTNKHTLLSIMHVPTPKCVDLIQKLKKCDNFNAFNAWKRSLSEIHFNFGLKRHKEVPFFSSN